MKTIAEFTMKNVLDYTNLFNQDITLEAKSLYCLRSFPTGLTAVVPAF